MSKLITWPSKQLCNILLTGISKYNTNMKVTSVFPLTVAPGA